jgi:hypothetical protein
MLSLSQRIRAFEQLRTFLNDFLIVWHKDRTYPTDKRFTELNAAIRKTIATNTWYTEVSIMESFSGIVELLNPQFFLTWINGYKTFPLTQKRVGVVMAGNIPMVGFHDFLCVLMSGHNFLGKLSSEDPWLLPVLADEIVKFDSDFSGKISFTTERLSGFDAIIATGSDNSARYFDYYFGKYPNIIRSNRNSLAILDGNEDIADFQKLAIDIFSFFGLGCRSVSNVLLPSGYDPTILFEGFKQFEDVKNHHKYFNNYEYNKAILMVNGDKYYDNGFLILKEEAQLSSPVAVLHYQFYYDKAHLSTLIDSNKSKIQCIVSKDASWPNSVNFGEAQRPRIHDYADNIDTMDFLLNLK